MHDDSIVRVVVVEDEPLGRRRLRELMKDVKWLHCLSEVADGRSAISAIDELQPDLIFLDIQLPGCCGLDVLKAISHAPAVIFTTAHDQFAVTAFELGALDYLLKPFGRDRFAKALQRARSSLDRNTASPVTGRAHELFTQGQIPRLFVRDA